MKGFSREFVLGFSFTHRFPFWLSRSTIWSTRRSFSHFSLLFPWNQQISLCNQPVKPGWAQSFSLSFLLFLKLLARSISWVKGHLVQVNWRFALGYWFGLVFPCQFRFLRIWSFSQWLKSFGFIFTFDKEFHFLFLNLILHLNIQVHVIEFRLSFKNLCLFIKPSLILMRHWLSKTKILIGFFVIGLLAYVWFGPVCCLGFMCWDFSCFLMKTFSLFHPLYLLS